VGMNTEISHVAEILTNELNAGRGSRQSLGAKAQPFAWSAGLPPTLADYCATATSAGMTFPAVIVGNSSTPAGLVAERGLKPLGASFTTANIPLRKFAGRATFTLEQTLDSAGLANVLTHVLGGQAVQALEAEGVAQLEASASETVNGTTLVEAVVAAQARVLANGGRPGILVLGTGGYADLVANGATGLVTDPAAGPVGRWLGMAVHVSPAVTDPAAAFVLDPDSVLVIQHETSPLVILDPFSNSSTNEISLVVDLVAAVAVTSPGGVVKASVGALALTGADPSRVKVG